MVVGGHPTGGFYAREAVEAVDFDARVVGETVKFAVRLGEEALGFFEGVTFEGVLFFGDDEGLAEAGFGFLQGEDFEVAEDGFNFLDFAWIAGGD